MGRGKRAGQADWTTARTALAKRTQRTAAWPAYLRAYAARKGARGVTRGGVRRRCCRGLWWGQCGKQFVFGYFVFACNMHTPGRQLDVWPIGWLLQRPLTTPPSPPLHRPSLPSSRCNVVLSPLWRQCTHALPTVRTMQQQDTTDRQRSAMSYNDKWFKTKGTTTCEHCGKGGGAQWRTLK